MAKEYKDRQMVAEGKSTQVFFFPKHVPPVSIEAASLEEAEAQLQAIEADPTND
jgi:hypothetical protein